MPKTFHNNFHTYSITRKREIHRTTNAKRIIGQTHMHTEQKIKQIENNGTKDFQS